MITIIPTSGISNRMRAIDSAISIANNTGHALQVIWIRDKKLNCKYSDLFLPIENVEIVEKSFTPLKFLRASVLNFYLPSIIRFLLGIRFYSKAKVHQLRDDKYDFEQITDSYSNVVFVSNLRFYPVQQPNALFKPIDQIRRRVEHITKSFTDHTVGIHVRRTDHKKAIESSPLALFFEAIENEIENENKSTFYVASDSSEVRDAMKDSFGSKIILNPQEPGRSTKEDIQHGLAELFSLSKTQKVYGSYGSSFSQTACEISSIPLIMLNQEKK